MFITQPSYNFVYEIESVVGRQVLITFRYINGKAHSEISVYGNYFIFIAIKLITSIQ
jgi:hypothetical protein